MVKKTKRILRRRAAAWAAAVLILLTALVACKPSEGCDDTTEPSGPVFVKICDNGMSEYEIVRPDKGYYDVLKEAVQSLRKAFSQHAGVDMNVSEDWVKDASEIPASATEILIGNTNRSESAQAAEGLKINDYRVKYFAASRRLVIVGGSDEATAQAVKLFTDSFVKECENGVIEIDETLDRCERGEYEASSLSINGHDVSEFEIVIPDAANRDEKYAAELIGSAIARKTGIPIPTVAVRKATGAPSIRIGGAADAVTLAVGELCVGSAAGAPEMLLIGGSGGYAVAAARRFIEKYIEGISGNAAVGTAVAEPAAFSAAVYPADEKGIIGGMRLALADQKNSVCAIVDIEAGDNAPVLWSFAPTAAKGFSVSKSDNRIDECRLRYSPVLGKYVFCITSSSGFIGVGEYPSGKCIFDTSLPGYGPHSIEYLPSGAIAVACSGNGNESKAMIRFYPANDKGAITLKCVSVALEGAHGIIWDDVREILWAVGTKEIVAFEVSGSGTGATISAIPGYRATLPKAGGHDISAYYGDPDRLWIGGGNIVIFNKQNGSFANAPGSVSVGGTKCIGNLDDGRIIRTVATGVYAAHDTDRYVIFDAEGKRAGEVIFNTRAFYKARIFDPRYT